MVSVAKYFPYPRMPHLQIFRTDESGLLELINPVIIKKSGKQNEVEGCLSIPGKAGITDRPAKVTVRALDRNGCEMEYTGEGLLARAFCHELDHLDGKLYPDVCERMLSKEELEAGTSGMVLKRFISVYQLPGSALTNMLATCSLVASFVIPKSIKASIGVMLPKAFK